MPCVNLGCVHSFYLNSSPPLVILPAYLPRYLTCLCRHQTLRRVNPCLDPMAISLSTAGEGETARSRSQPSVTKLITLFIVLGGLVHFTLFHSFGAAPLLRASLG